MSHKRESRFRIPDSEIQIPDSEIQESFACEIWTLESGKQLKEPGSH